jgi:hypothetical protein
MFDTKDCRFCLGLILAFFIAVWILPVSAKAEFGIKAGYGISSFTNGEYTSRLDSSCNTIVNLINETTNAVYDTLNIQIAASIEMPGVLTNKQAITGGVYGRFMLHSKIDKEEQATNILNLLTELNWERASVRFDFGRDISASISTSQDVSIDQFLTVQSAVNQSVFIISDSLNDAHSVWTTDFLQIPLMLELQQTYPQDATHYNFASTYLHFGPSLRFRINGREDYSEAMKTLVTTMYDSYNFAIVPPDNNTEVVITENTVQSNLSDVSKNNRVVSASFIVGCGIQIRNIFKMGVGSDTFCIDIRCDLGLGGINKDLAQPFVVNCLTAHLGYMF